MGKSIAIMQPYLFPYLGYFQLVSAADEFIFFDDVNFIKKGWINRNYILANDKATLFTVPLLKPSQNKYINDTKIHPGEFSKFKKSFLTTLQHSYAKAPFFKQIIGLINEVLGEDTSIANLASKSIQVVSEYLQFQTDFNISSNINSDQKLKGQERILNLCQTLNASEYINLSGGKDLYQVEGFQQKSIDLKFIETDFLSLEKLDPAFNFKLSIIHLLMHFSPQQINKFLKNYKLT